MGHHLLITGLAVNKNEGEIVAPLSCVPLFVSKPAIAGFFILIF